MSNLSLIFNLSFQLIFSLTLFSCYHLKNNERLLTQKLCKNLGILIQINSFFCTLGMSFGSLLTPQLVREPHRKKPLCRQPPEFPPKSPVLTTLLSPWQKLTFNCLASLLEIPALNFTGKQTDNPFLKMTKLDVSISS